MAVPDCKPCQNTGSDQIPTALSVRTGRFPLPRALGAAASQRRSGFPSDDPENRGLIQRDGCLVAWITVSGQGESVAGGKSLWQSDGELVVNPRRHCPTAPSIWWTPPNQLLLPNLILRAQTGPVVWRAELWHLSSAL